MTAVSVPSTSFRFGYTLGTLTREFMRSLKRTTPAVPAQAQPVVRLASIAPTRNDWDELCRIPTLARRGVDLNQWFDVNTKAVPPTKRRPRQRKPSKTKAPELRMDPLNELDHIPEPRVLRPGSLDQLIAPVSEQPEPGSPEYWAAYAKSDALRIEREREILADMDPDVVASLGR